ncbi:MAG: transglutaminase-like domain-containing protein [candidate division Zixibacteria bacterium]
MGCVNIKKVFFFTVIIVISTPLLLFASDNPNRFDNFLGTEWYGIYLQGGKIGYASTTIEKTNYPIDGWRMNTDMTMIISMMGTTDTITTKDVRLFESPGGELYSSRAVISGGTGDITIEGSKEADEYIVTTNIGGQAITKPFPFPLDYLDSLVFLKTKVSSGDLSIGDSLLISSFDPMPPLTGKVHQSVKITSKDVYVFNGVPTDVYTAEWTILEMGVTGRTIIDITGRELEYTPGGGILWKLETESMAKTLDVTFDFLTDNLVYPQKTIEDPQSLKSVKLLISGIGEEDILRTEGQTVTKRDSGILEVDIVRSELPSKTLELPIESARLKPFLEAGPYIQSNSDEIINLAREIVGDEKNSWEAAQLIGYWVYANIERRFTPDLSNALQTLHSKQGDCGEYAALTVALMRAAGIPTRPVAGLVYWPPGDGFGYHAWVEVFVGEWVMMDPSWDEDLINPSHIALARGDIIDQVGILTRVMGKMGIEVLEAR